MRSPRPTAIRTGEILLALALVAAVVAVRAFLYRDLPALLTNDSWDYLKAAQDIQREADYFSLGLRDVRLPGYSTLLAAAHPLTGWCSDSIVLLQTVLGLATVMLGWAMGRLVGSRLASCAMVACLGLNPVYLLNEHAVMCEAFALTLYMLLMVVGLAAWRRRADDWPTWAAFGALLGLCLLTRANVLALGLTIAAGACFLKRRKTPADDGRSSLVGRSVLRLRPLLVTGAVAFLVIAPWIWRNWAMYGQLSYFSSTNRNLVMYKNMHRPLDPSSPTLASVNRTLGYHKIDFEWLRKFSERYPPHEAEELARRILHEDIAKHRWRHLRQIAHTAAGFGGFNDVHRTDRAMLYYWFSLVHDVWPITQLGYAEGASLLHDWFFAPVHGDTIVSRLFARAGHLYLQPGRAIAFVAFVGLFLLYVVYVPWDDDPDRATRRHIVLILSAGYLATLATHAVTLMDFDRYSTMFDFLTVFLGAVMVDELLLARPSTGRTRHDGYSPADERRTSVRPADSYGTALPD